METWAQKKHLTVPFLSKYISISLPFIFAKYKLHSLLPAFDRKNFHYFYLPFVTAFHSSRMCVCIRVNASLLVHACVYCAYVHACMREHKHIYVYLCVLTCLCLCEWIYMDTCGFECVCAWLREYTCVCMCICVPLERCLFVHAFAYF